MAAFACILNKFILSMSQWQELGEEKKYRHCLIMYCQCLPYPLSNHSIPTNMSKARAPFPFLLFLLLALLVSLA